MGPSTSSYCGLMRLAHLKVERFRGIKSLDWPIEGRITCLVGAGDMCKTTILDAINLLGTPRTPVFSDADFFGGSVDPGPILVEGVFTDLPAAVLSDARFGLDLIGLDDAGELLDEPGEFAAALQVSVDIDASLEPVWRLISARNPEGRLLSARDRAELAVGRLGTNTDRQFSLARGSALSRGVADRTEVAAILSEAYRSANAAVKATDLSALAPAVEGASATAKKVGAGAIADNMSIGLELSPTSSGGLSLHSSDLPVGGSGLGTRRLLALGLELGNAHTSGVLCIDEIEHGLEPHRIRHLISTLAELVEHPDGATGGHVLFTTHSPVVLGELGSSGVVVVRNELGVVDARPVPDGLKSIVRSTPEALLAPRVVVGEGKTEVGILRAFDREWAVGHNGRSLAQMGVTIVDGGGHTAARRSLQLVELGVPVLVVADSDVDLDPGRDKLEAEGITVVQWRGNMATEDSVFADLPWSGLSAAFEFVVEQDRAPESVIDAVAGSLPGAAAMARLGIERSAVTNTLEGMLEAGFVEIEVRSAFAAAAKSKANSWFKRIDLGQVLGEIVIAHPMAPTAAFLSSMEEIETWCHG